MARKNNTQYPTGGMMMPNMNIMSTTPGMKSKISNIPMMEPQTTVSKKKKPARKKRAA